MDGFIHFPRSGFRWISALSDISPNLTTDWPALGPVIGSLLYLYLAYLCQAKNLCWCLFTIHEKCVSVSCDLSELRFRFVNENNSSYTCVVPNNSSYTCVVPNIAQIWPKKLNNFLEIHQVLSGIKLRNCFSQQFVNCLHNVIQYSTPFYKV